MKKIVINILLCLVFSAECYAEKFDPEAGKKGSFAISNENIKITGWASSYENYLPGDDVFEEWKKPEKSLGKAEGTSTDIVSLGRDGEITLVFENGIKNNKGYDFAVFENSFSHYFLELANVYVSSNGIDFAGFKTISNTSSPVSSFGTIDPVNIKNFAGKYKQGYGTGFDLEELKDNNLVAAGKIDLNNIRYIKIKDIPGDGSVFDSNGNPVYDPYPTKQSAGFDLDGACSLSGVFFEDSGNSGDDNNSGSDSGDSGSSQGSDSNQGAGFGGGGGGGCFIESLFQP